MEKITNNSNVYMSLRKMPFWLLYDVLAMSKIPEAEWQRPNEPKAIKIEAMANALINHKNQNKINHSVTEMFEHIISIIENHVSQLKPYDDKPVRQATELARQITISKFLNTPDKQKLETNAKMSPSFGAPGFVVSRKTQNNAKFSMLVKAHMISLVSLPDSNLINFEEISAGMDKETDDEYSLHFDASMPHPNKTGSKAGLGVVITNKRTKQKQFFSSKVDTGKLGDILVGESMALNFGLNIALNLGIKNISIYGDSRDTFRLMQNTAVHNNRTDLFIIAKKIQKLLTKFNIAECLWIPREANVSADHAASAAFIMPESMSASKIVNKL